MMDCDTIAVTGGLGFVGTSLIPELLKQGVKRIKVLDNYSNHSGDLQLDDRIEITKGDILSVADVEAFVTDDIDVFIHLAGHTRVIDSIESPIFNFETNVQSFVRILERCRVVGVPRVVLASTGGAILGEVPPPIHEEIAAKPASPYGASKLACEAYCSAYAQSFGMKCVSLRFSNLYGPHSKKKKSVVAAFLDRIAAEEKLVVYGDGEQTRDYLYVEDLVGGIVNAIERNVTGVYQLGSGVPNSVNTLLQIFREVTKVDFEVEYKDARSGEILHTFCDISKARNELDFNPPTGLEQGIQKTWDWYQLIP